MSGDGGRPDGRRRRRGPLAAADDADPGDVVDDSAWLPSPRAKRRVANRVVVSWAAEQPDQQLALINAGVTGTVCWGVPWVAECTTLCPKAAAKCLALGW